MDATDGLLSTNPRSHSIAQLRMIEQGCSWNEHSGFLHRGGSVGSGGAQGWSEQGNCAISTGIFWAGEPLPRPPWPQPAQQLPSLQTLSDSESTAAGPIQFAWESAPAILCAIGW